MTDRLQFRGYPGYQIPAEPLADREIEFDLTRDTLVIGINKTYVLTENTGYTRSQVDQLIQDNFSDIGLQGIQGYQAWKVNRVSLALLDL